MYTSCLQDFRMTENICSYDVPEKCIEDILSLIKPVEDDRNKRMYAIQELTNSIPSVGPLRGAVFKPFGSFVSNLYSNSGDLDISVQLTNVSTTTVTKKKKQTVLRELMRALKIRGVANSMQFIPQARVPVLQYVSNSFGISCDISVHNYPGRIKSKIFYWISTLDVRFADMVLLIKEWAKAQNINDPKTGTLNSYSFCLLVLFHLQTCEPAILPPLEEIYEGNIREDIAGSTMYNEEHLDEICSINLAKFQRNKQEQINESSLCHLLASFFQKFSSIGTLSGDVISTYTGQFKRIQDNPSWMAKSYSLFVEDPIERPDNAARAVDVKGLDRIASAFSAANRKFASLERASRNDLLAMLCTPGVGSKLGIRVTANSYNSPRRSHQHAEPVGRGSARSSDNQHHNRATEIADGRPVVHNPTRVNDIMHQTNEMHRNLHRQHVIDAGRQTAGPYQSSHPGVYTRDLQTAGSQNYNHPGVYSRDLQTAGSQNYNHPGVYTRDLQTAGYQNYSHPGVYTRDLQTAGYQNYNHPGVYNRNLQTAGFQNYSHPGMYTTGLQTVEPYQINSQSQVLQTPRQYSNHIQQSPARNYNHQSLRAAASETEGSYWNQQQRQQAPARQANRNAVTARYEPVVGRSQNGPSQDSSRRGGWQREQPTASTYQKR
ncbi:hypothetical protein GUJ93_ZPchr0007g5211 [Zizania palustris]|uniref:Poly(A) RNA polymerase mitochondrial-like central palm domain-containing protein n=1 Tax=Zizania palustris TaxID=103762 RepID=A0A8J5VNA7_ZIZPA|nr:hypothetical protein GUJ93_ZPchr0007g5211 [Zizania palustris]